MGLVMVGLVVGVLVGLLLGWIGGRFEGIAEGAYRERRRNRAPAGPNSASRGPGAPSVVLERDSMADLAEGPAPSAAPVWVRAEREEVR